MEDEALYGELLEIANELSALSGRVRQVCVEAQRRFPSNGFDIPGTLAGVHRALSTAGNSLATTAEAAAMLRLAVGPVPAGAASVRRRADSVLEQVNDAERRLAEATARRPGLTDVRTRPLPPGPGKFPVKRLASGALSLAGGRRRWQDGLYDFFTGTDFQ